MALPAQRPPSLVFSNLYLGNDFNACYRVELVERNIRSLLNCSFPQSPSPFSDEPANFTVRAIELYDTDDADIRQYFDLVYEFIDECIANSSCLVYCRTGNNRSAAIVAAYIMRKTRCTLIEALRHLHSIRSTIDIRKGFLWQLGEYEIELLGYSSINKLPTQRVLTSEVVGLPYSSLIPSLADLVIETHEDMVIDTINNKICQGQWSEVGSLFTQLKTNRQFSKLTRRIVYQQVRGEVERLLLQPVPTAFADCLDFIRRLYSFAVDDFKGDPSILNAINQAITSVVKANKKLTAKLSATYLSSVVGSCGKTHDNTSIANALREVYPILRNEESERLIFEEAYLICLLKRFIQTREFNDEAEMVFVHQLRELGLQKFADDIQNALSDFKTAQLVIPRSSCTGARISVQSFTVERWPTHFLLRPLTKNATDEQNSVTAMLTRMARQLPADFLQLWTDYASSEFFNNAPPMQLYLLPHLGTCETIFNTGKKKFKLTLTTPMMLVLSQFDELETTGSMTVSEILTRVGLPEEIVLSAVYSLACTPPPKCSATILLKTPALPKIKDTDMLTVNTAFDSAQRTIRVVSKKYNPVM